MSNINKITFNKAFDEYLIYTKKRLKPQSYTTFYYNFKANILTYFADCYINDLSSIDIINWQDYIIKKDFCNNHNKNLYCMLKEFLSFCSKHYGIKEDIFLDIPQFQDKIEKKSFDFYTEKEFNKFIKCIDNNIYKQFFNLMFYTGVRPGEAMALKFSDLTIGYININKTIDEHGKRNLGTPKTNSSNRLIAIDKKLQKDLFELKDYYIKKYNDNTSDFFIFGGIKPLAPTTINRYKFKACKKANLRPITLHQFRHSHATFLLNKNIEIHVISNRLGHSKTSTTLNVYTHANLEQEKRVINTLNSSRFNIFDCSSRLLKKLISILKH